MLLFFPSHNREACLANLSTPDIIVQATNMRRIVDELLNVGHPLPSHLQTGWVDAFRLHGSWLCLFAEEHCAAILKTKDLGAPEAQFWADQSTAFSRDFWKFHNAESAKTPEWFTSFPLMNKTHRAHLLSFNPDFYRPIFGETHPAAHIYISPSGLVW